jgi:hypothetical protein
VVRDERWDEDDDGRGHAPRELARLFLRLVDEAVEAARHGERRDPDDDDCRHRRPPKPVPPGGTAPPVSVPSATVEQLTTAALGAAYVAADKAPLAQVVWSDADGEVLVHVDRTQVAMFPGLVLVALTLETDETGAGQIVVPFAVGGPDSPAGLVVVTESRPRGPVALVDRWGQAATAAAWQALLDVAHGLALQSGVDADGARLIPGALSTDGATLSVTPQARHPADRILGQ